MRSGSKALCRFILLRADSLVLLPLTHHAPRWVHLPQPWVAVGVRCGNLAAAGTFPSCLEMNVALKNDDYLMSWTFQLWVGEYWNTEG